MKEKKEYIIKLTFEQLDLLAWILSESGEYFDLEDNMEEYESMNDMVHKLRYERV